MSRLVLKLYGERNTGTNYLGKLIELNLAVDQLPGVVPAYVETLQQRLWEGDAVRDLYFSLTFHNNLGWKHSLVHSPSVLRKYRITKRGVGFVTMTKNPYSWLLSLYRRPYSRQWKIRPDFKTFVRSRWINEGRANAPATYENPVEMWNRKNEAYIRLATELPTLNLRYVDVVADPAQAIDRIGTRFSLKRRPGGFFGVDYSTKDADKDYGYYRNYYVDELWRRELFPRVLDIINRQLDPHVMAYFGYQRIEASAWGTAAVS